MQALEVFEEMDREETTEERAAEVEYHGLAGKLAAGVVVGKQFIKDVLSRAGKSRDDLRGLVSRYADSRRLAEQLKEVPELEQQIRTKEAKLASVRRKFHEMELKFSAEINAISEELQTITGRLCALQAAQSSLARLPVPEPFKDRHAEAIEEGIALTKTEQELLNDISPTGGSRGAQARTTGRQLTNARIELKRLKTRGGSAQQIAAAEKAVAGWVKRVAQVEERLADVRRRRDAVNKELQSIESMKADAGEMTTV